MPGSHPTWLSATLPFAAWLLDEALEENGMWAASLHFWGHNLSGNCRKMGFTTRLHLVFSHHTDWCEFITFLARCVSLLANSANQREAALSGCQMLWFRPAVPAKQHSFPSTLGSLRCHSLRSQNKASQITLSVVATVVEGGRRSFTVFQISSKSLKNTMYFHQNVNKKYSRHFEMNVAGNLEDLWLQYHLSLALSSGL